jgi:hypothetical protein
VGKDKPEKTEPLPAKEFALYGAGIYLLADLPPTIVPLVKLELPQ